MNTSAFLNVVRTPRAEKKTVSTEEKTAEIELAVFVACHTSIRAVDHLGEWIRQRGAGSTLGNLRLHRTKCASLIRNVLSPALKDQLKKAAGGKKFTLVVDESTDVGCQKLLCLIVRYVDSEKGVVDAFLGLVPVLETNAETLFLSMKNELETFGLSLKDCIGFASDGASVMIGVKNSVWTRIKNVSPHCIQMRCICHSLALCIQHAFSKLPSNLGFLLTEVPSWFSHSCLRRDAFKRIFDTLNADIESESGVSHPTPFMRASTTRWLVRGKVMYNILANWEELICYFTIAEQECPNDRKYKARLIKEMLQDRMNFLLFHFATPVVQEFESINAKFQSSNADPHELTKELYTFHRSLRSRLYSPLGEKREIRSCDLGYKFVSECEKYLLEVSEDKKEAEVRRVAATKERCHMMLGEAVRQVEERLPSSENVFAGLSLLSPVKVLNQLDRARFEDLPFLHLLGEKVSTIEEQYRKIVLIDWSSEPVFKGSSVPKETLPFWEGIRKTQMKELAEYALTCLLTPASNAGIERIFSLVTSTKTKPRNKLGVASLDAIIRVKSHVFNQGKCCNDFTVTKQMLELCTSDVLYATNTLCLDQSSDAETSASKDADLEQFL